MNANPTRGLRAVAALGASLAVLATPIAAAAQSPPTARPAAAVSARRLALDEAVRLAEAQSEALTIARAGMQRARGQHLQARSQQLPQLNAVGSYARTLKSQFEAFAEASQPVGPPPPPPVCAPEIPENATPEQRNAALAQAITCPSGDGIDFGSVGFGAKNQWTLGLNFSQTLFAGGRVIGGIRAADAGRRAAEIEVTAQRAQIALDAAEAYYDAALADRLVAIADSTLVQTEEVLRQTRLARQVGNQSEFELLRAQVTRDNARPTVIQARSSRSIAYLRLKQLLNLPLDEELQLTTSIDEPLSPTAVLPAGLGTTRTTAVAASDTAADNRSVVRQAAENARAQESLFRVARGERYPSIALTSQYQRLYFPQSGFPDLGDALQNWTVGASVSMNLFSGGRIRGGEMIARANVDEARAQLQQVRELAALDARVALNQLAEAEAVWAASQGTVEQASRAYRIDQIRYREGISTQTDLGQSRILLEQATANRALASRDLAVARIRLALLRDLPLQSGGAAQGAARAGAGAAGAVNGTRPGAGAAPQQQQPRTTPQAAAASASAGQIGGVQP
jgi:outer membrane protein TolC